LDRDEFVNDLTILELVRIIKEFKSEFKRNTSDTEKFLTINELENRWTELRNCTDVLYSDMVRQLIREVDEREMVRKKKQNTLQKE
jgi:hypothetical protein